MVVAVAVVLRPKMEIRKRKQTGQCSSEKSVYKKYMDEGKTNFGCAWRPRNREEQGN